MCTRYARVALMTGVILLRRVIGVTQLQVEKTLEASLKNSNTFYRADDKLGINPRTAQKLVKKDEVQE